MVIERSLIEHNDKWNVEALYPNYDTWYEEFHSICKDSTPRWPDLASFKGRFADSPETVKNCLDLAAYLSRKLTNLYTYAHLKHDEDITEDKSKTAYNQILAILHEFNMEASWIEPELIALPETTISAYLSSPILKDYQFHIEKIVRVKKHVLTPEKEELLALAGNALQTGIKAFRAINDADFSFGKIKNSNGEELELTHGTYALFLRQHDRPLRQQAFQQLHGQYKHYENTLCELLNGQVQSHLFHAKARNYSSCLESALFPKNIDVEVYHALIDAVHNKIGALHRYIKLRKQVLGLKDLQLSDMYVPLISEIDIKLPYHKAEELVIESVAPLGKEYQNILHKGLKEDRWVDRYENKNKRSGAYSSGCYDSMPYILMNYKDILRDVFTLAHEAGHSMHSYLSHKHQPYIYSDYPIFLAEVASTFNEELLTRLMLSSASSIDEKIFLINQKIEDIRATLFRQTMFAEFELTLHTFAENHIPLTPKLLNESLDKLNRFYFGDEVVYDPISVIEWARIPHFYYNFYVFQYATGISAALALADKVINEGETAREAYLSFLKGGSSAYPIDLLKRAGVDMRTPGPVQSAIEKFDHLVIQLETLLAEKKSNT